jgi:UDP-N-acetylmuramoyl-tripeptide--D-alanyl-D-alanine ligase
MARYYQIEEYNTPRYLRWLAGSRGRWFPRQKAIIMLAGIIISGGLQFADVDPPALHFALWLLVAGLLCLPEPVKETKKTFVRTPRAMRMVGVAFGVDVVVALGISALAIMGTQSGIEAELSSAAIIGFFAVLLSPLALPAANGLLYPIEERKRKHFLQLAHQRLKDSGAVTIGITGSYGKTSTKTFLAHILSARYKVFPTPKSYNTEMGVSRAINEDFDPHLGYDYFIAEMGAYIPGEVGRICQLTEPQISIVTAVGPMHLERFGTLENVVKAKYEIVEGLPADGTAIFNGDNPYVREMAARGYPNTRILVSSEGLPEARIVAENIQEATSGLTFDVHDRESDERQPFATSVIGLHNVTNILLVTAVGRHLGLALAEIAKRVATLTPAEHRLRQTVHPNGITVLDDAYSANPVGAASALNALNLHQEGRRIVITPGMVELGTVQSEENYKLGQLLAQTASDIILVGIKQTADLQRAVTESTFDPSRLLVVDTFEEARQWFQAQVRPGDTVLFLNDLPDTYL